MILSQFLDGNEKPLATEEERIFFENMKNAMKLKYGWENTSDITRGTLQYFLLILMGINNENILLNIETFVISILK